MQEPLTIGDTIIQAGQRATVALPMAKLYTRTDMTLTAHVIHGRKPGPRLFICSTLHGDEINGIEIVRQLLKRKDINNLHGTLIAIPVVNSFGFIQRSRYLPDHRDLNRSFPGSEKGSLGSRLAALFLKEIVAGCTHGIDLHTGSNHRFNLPQVRACLDDPETERLAHAFGAPVVINSHVRDGSLRAAMADMGITVLLYESGEAFRFDDLSIRTGVKGIVSVMRAIGMLPEDGDTCPSDLQGSFLQMGARANQRHADKFGKDWQNGRQRGYPWQRVRSLRGEREDRVRTDFRPGYRPTQYATGLPGRCPVSLSHQGRGSGPHPKS